MIERFQEAFPEFYQALLVREGRENNEFLPPASLAQIEEIESRCGVPLPESYKNFLKCCRGMTLLDGRVQFGIEHPFFHNFPPLENLNENYRDKEYPPPSQGMLCFAEFFMESDGDQVLWDVSNGLVAGEYPIFYYAHETKPPTIRKLSDNFKQWLVDFLSYEEFKPKN